MLTYNHELFVREALESVLAQHYPNLEVVVSDDASADRTPEILREYAARYPDVVRIRLGATNVGIVSNSNRALAACTGEYIAWTAGDDVMLPGKLWRQVDLMEQDSDCVLCYHDLEVFDSDTGITLSHFNSGPHGRIPHEGGADVLVRHGAFLGGCSVMGRRRACPADGYDSRLRLASDWMMWIDMARAGTVRYIPEVLGRYRRHSGNVTLRAMDILQDERTTLDLVEARYPHLARHVRHRRGVILIREGLGAVSRGHVGEGLMAITRGIRRAGIADVTRTAYAEARWRWSRRVGRH